MKKKLKSKKKKQGRAKSILVRRTLGPVDLKRLDSEYARAGHFMQTGDLRQAAEAYKGVLRIDPNHAQSINMLAVIALEDGQSEQAEKFVRMAIGLNPENPGYYNNHGLALMDLEKIEEAVGAFQKALHWKPDFVDAHINLGNAFKSLGKVDKAVEMYKQALAMQPDDADILNNLGNAYRDQENIDAAIEYYQKALQQDNQLVTAHISLVSCFEKSNRLEEARQAINHALMADQEFHTVFILAKIEYREGNYQKAKEHINMLDLEDVPLEEYKSVLSLAGSIYEKLGEYADAFSRFSQVNDKIWEEMREKFSRKQKENDNYTMRPGGLRDWFSKSTAAKWPVFDCEDGLPAPVFLVGFSRSGTTLLDQVLYSHSAILTLEEKDTLQHLIKDFCQESSRHAFDNLTQDQFSYQRQKYWKTIDEFLDIPRGDAIVIDRNPFYTIRLGHICRFFPETKIIVAIRDPRDVCLSNFFKNFNINDATANFITLEQTAQYYAEVMELLFHFRQVLPLQMHTVHYENLVMDFEGEVRRLLDFLGLSWEDGVQRFNETAKTRLVNTASYDQVIKPLYKTAAGRWKNYEQFLKPVLPVLEPFVKVFEAERKKNE